MKTRFCPSPTGLMHLGNVRTAFFNYLAAHAKGGKFLLRIEDTDATRSYVEYTKLLMEDLRWLGLDWQEGPEVEGENGPYWQSERQDIYNHYYKILEEKKLVYPCFCSEQQLALSRKMQRASGKPPRYAETCRHLLPEEVQEKLSQGLKPALRFKIPKDNLIEFVDLVRGKQQFKSNDIGDFIIRRADGTAPFMYGNALDDALMGVTHLLRGEDHLTNTPRQLMILEALDLVAPQYGHMSLIVGNDGAPLSKRHGSRSLQALREEGFLPEALLNYLARLGHIYESNKFMPLAELAQNFNINTLSKAAARFDEKQLLHWQKEAILQLEHHILWERFDEVVHKIVPPELATPFTETIQPNILFAKEATFWVDVIFSEELSYSHEQQDILKLAGLDFFNAAITAIQEQGCDYMHLVNSLKGKLGVKGKQLFQPLRIALTAESHGPELDKILSLLGADEAVKRFEKALHICV